MLLVSDLTVQVPLLAHAEDNDVEQGLVTTEVLVDVRVIVVMLEVEVASTG